MSKPILFNMSYQIKKDEKKRDMKEVQIDIGADIAPIIIVRHHKSRSGPNGDTVESMTSTLNHFTTWVHLRNNDNENFLRYVLTYLDSLLNRNSIAATTTTVLSTNMGANEMTIPSIELEYFTQVMTKLLVNNQKLIKMVSDYVYDMTVYNFEATTLGSGEKIRNEDIHIKHMIAVFSKIIHIYYFRITGVGTFNKACRSLIIGIANACNDFVRDNVYTTSYDYLNTSYIDRLYLFIEYSSKTEYTKHSQNISRFSCIGLSQTSLSNSVLDEMLGAVARLQASHKTNQSSEEMFNENSVFDDFGFVAKRTASFLQNTKANVIQRLAGSRNSKYIINSHNATVDEDDTSSEVSRYEAFMEKDNTETAAAMGDYKSYILDYCKTNTLVGSEVSYKLLDSGFKKNKLNMFLVSTFMESKFGVDISELLSLSQFLDICIYIHEKLTYPNLKYAILGIEYKRLNKTSITDDDIPEYLRGRVDTERLKSFLSDICSKEYIVRTMTEVSETYKIKKELIEYMENVS